LDFVHDDVLALTRIDSEFNLIKYFCVEGLNANGLVEKRIYLLDEMI